MHLSDHDLRQMDEGWLENLPEDKLRQVSARILQDLKEARDRLNQTPDNSSRPPSSRAPWEKGQAEGDEPDIDGGGAEVSGETGQSAAGGEPAQGKPPAGPKKKQGKQPGAKGFGRTQKFAVTERRLAAAAYCPVMRTPHAAGCHRRLLRARHAV
jgi:hypothetical protein